MAQINTRNNQQEYSSKSKSNPNPYFNFYRQHFGYVFGRPLAYLPKTDPNQRVFQSTMLRNNTIINVIPGRAHTDEAMLEKASEILTKFNAEYEKAVAKGASSTELDKILEKHMNAMSAAKVDLRFAAFRQDTAGFMKSMQGVLNYVSTALFTGIDGGTLLDIAGTQISESTATRGFKIWVEKGTSISETVENSFTKSVLETVQKEASNVVKQLKFLGMSVGATTVANETTEVQSANETLQAVGNLASMASRTAGGAVFDFPQIFESSNFNRSYDISFRFVSAYGDDRSIYYHVLVPFIFLLTMALPKQDGPTGHQAPFLVQVDAPGFFSCPMGVVTSFSFKKGGDDMLFNDRGLPLILEGTMSIMDLYSNLSLPLNHAQFATNFGAAAFLGGLGGLPLYAAHDPSLKDQMTNYLKSLTQAPLYMYGKVKQDFFALARYLGVGPGVQ